MAKIRMVNTRIWDDAYFSELERSAKLLFVYFITNSSTDICGIYEITLRKIANETGIPIEEIKEILVKFKKDRKILYKNGWVAIKNFIFHQAVNPSVLKGIEIGLNKAPKDIIDTLGTEWGQAVTEYIQGFGNLNLNLNLNSNLNNAPNGAVSETKKKKRESNEPIKWDEYMKGMETDSRDHIQLIGYYFKRRKLRYDTYGEVQEAISRHLRYAVKVHKFSKEKVFKAMDQCDKLESDKGIAWTLETVYKHLTK